MPLPLEGTRVLSPLERDAVKLVFEDAIDLWDISLTVVESFKPRPLWAAAKLPQVASTYDGDGNIRINRSVFPHTDSLNINSTRTDTEIFKPGNMHYLSTLIHECTHYWQEEYGRHGPPVSHANAPPQPADYKFVSEQLKQRDVPDLSSEQHASAAQVYFLIEWQLRYQPKGSDVNLTSQSPNSEDNVVPVDRFHDIDRYINNSGKGTSRIVKYQKAHESIHNNFGWLIVELRYGWKVVCQGREPFAKATGG